jgi:hypothetical protein
MKNHLGWFGGVCLLLSACGGGGGGDSDSSDNSDDNIDNSPTLSVVQGKAAAGGPIIGLVTIKDSSSPAEFKVSAIAADGSFSFDVSDMTAPFMVRAEGTVGGASYSIYSAAASADINGNINITPLSDLIIANIAGQLAANYFSSGDFSALTTTALDTAESALQARLQPVLTAIGLADSIDLLRTSFNPDHTGLDAALDVLRVTTDTDTAVATITNVLDNVSITDDLTSTADASVITQSTVATGLTEFQQIAAKFASLTSYFAGASLPSPSDPGLNALFDGTNFLWDGDDLSTILSALTSNQLFLGMKFTNVTLESISGSTAKVGFVVQYSGKTQHFNWQLNKPASEWLFAGNQRIGYVSVNALADRDQNGTIKTGLWIEVDNLNVATPDYAVVTGSALPTSTGGANGTSAGLLLFNDGTGEFVLAAPSAAYNGTGTTPDTSSNDQYWLGDTAINTISDGTVYTITIYEDNGTVGNLTDDTAAATYTDKLKKRPALSTELSAASFPAISTSATTVSTVANAGGNLTVDWTLPTGVTAENVYFYRSYMDTSFDDAETEVSGSATTGTLTIGAPTGTISAHGISVHATDIFGRDLDSRINN